MTLSFAFACALAACGSTIDAGGVDTDAGPDDDPLAIADTSAPGSLDDLHHRIIVKSCAGQPGLCHAGQFEPNLSTPALSYENLVNRPGLEHDKQLRVKPGDAANSLFIDKLRFRNVETQMPLGADPLSEEEIAEIEAWISDGALRRPGADPAPVLNNAPYAPELAVFDAAGDRLDLAGPFTVQAGETVTLRLSVNDFETSDEDVIYALFILQVLSTGDQVALAPGTMNPNLAFAAFDPGAPEGAGDLLNWKLDWTIPTDVVLLDPAMVPHTEPSSGLTFSVIGYYVDELTVEGMATYAFKPDILRVE